MAAREMAMETRGESRSISNVQSSSRLAGEFDQPRRREYDPLARPRHRASQRRRRRAAGSVAARAPGRSAAWTGPNLRASPAVRRIAMKRKCPLPCRRSDRLDQGVEDSPADRNPMPASTASGSTIAKGGGLGSGAEQLDEQSCDVGRGRAEHRRVYPWIIRVAAKGSKPGPVRPGHRPSYPAKGRAEARPGHRDRRPPGARPRRAGEQSRAGFRRP